MQRQKAHTWESGAVNPNKLHPRETSAEEAEPAVLIAHVPAENHGRYSQEYA